MKLYLTEQDWNETPPLTKQFIEIWKQRKNHDNQLLTLGQVIELLLATSFTFYKEDSDPRFFNNLLTNEESLVAWDGNELIDILYYECCQNIKKRLGKGRTFNSEVDNIDGLV